MQAVMKRTAMLSLFDADRLVGLFIDYGHFVDRFDNLHSLRDPAECGEFVVEVQALRIAK